ncbi:MAG: AAA family ATPase [Clostridiales Family XIII bacterium]|jgi:SpoVK/Ycf46/Vps4 family AAA+-type ATPase|nr:AAA family ATPase [Clostridiales Family XIII bacterium]
MIAYNVIAKTETGKRLGVIKNTTKQVIIACNRLNDDEICFAPVNINGSSIQMVILANNHLPTNVVTEKSKALMKLVSPKLVDRKIRKIKISEFLNSIRVANTGGFISNDEAKFLSDRMNSSLLTEEGARTFLVEMCLKNNCKPDAALFARVGNSGELFDPAELHKYYYHWENKEEKTPLYEDATDNRQDPSHVGDIESDERKQALRELLAVLTGKAQVDSANQYLQSNKSKMLIQKSPAIKELDNLIGLEDVKKLINKILTYASVMKIHPKGKTTRHMHMVFAGNPGSAKTTVARLLTNILYEAGIIKSNKLKEVGRADLIGKYAGYTPQLTKDAFNKAKGSVLFIDEAYSLVDYWSGAYGDEAINTIVQEMENNTDTIVILAGYPDKMKNFIERNEGLKSRIKFHVNFPDYSTVQMYEILELMTRENGYMLDDNVRDTVLPIFDKAAQKKDSGNGRFVRNIFESAELNWAERIAQQSETGVTQHDLMYLTASDFVMPEEIEIAPDTPKIGFCV